jgi:hypothetical protein
MPNGVVNRTSIRAADATRMDPQYHWCRTSLAYCCRFANTGLRRFFFLRVSHSFCILRQRVDDLRVRGRGLYKPARGSSSFCPANSQRESRIKSIKVEAKEEGRALPPGLIGQLAAEKAEIRSARPSLASRAYLQHARYEHHIVVASVYKRLVRI